MKKTKLLSIKDFEQTAQQVLPKAVFGFVSGGSEDCVTLKHNLSAFKNIFFQPRGLVDVSERTQKTELFGHVYDSVIGVAPMGVTSICRYRCDLEIANAAQKHNIPYVLSGAATESVENIQKAIGNAWYQGYFSNDRSRMKALMDRLDNAGINVLVITSDTPVGANRENNLRHGFTIPFRPSLPLMLDGLLHPRWLAQVFIKTLIKDGIPHFRNMDAHNSFRITEEPSFGFRGGRDSLTWEDLRWVRDNWRGKLVVKGILHQHDAIQAIDCGADGIIVSNHGGRQLDSAVPSIAALPAIVKAVPARYPLMIDSGFRRGSDVLKAIALGASMVFVGRPVLYGAALNGASGAGQVIGILKDEIARNLALLGCSNVGDLDINYLSA